MTTTTTNIDKIATCLKLEEMLKEGEAIAKHNLKCWEEEKEAKRKAKALEAYKFIKIEKLPYDYDLEALSNLIQGISKELNVLRVVEDQRVRRINSRQEGYTHLTYDELKEYQPI